MASAAVFRVTGTTFGLKTSPHRTKDHFSQDQYSQIKCISIITKKSFIWQRGTVLGTLCMRGNPEAGSACPYPFMSLHRTWGRDSGSWRPPARNRAGDNDHAGQWWSQTQKETEVTGSRRKQGRVGRRKLLTQRVQYELWMRERGSAEPSGWCGLAQRSMLTADGLDGGGAWLHGLRESNALLTLLYCKREHVVFVRWPYMELQCACILSLPL